MKSLKGIFFIMAMVSLLITSCSKDDEEDEPTGLEYQQPAVANKTTVIEIPDGLQAKANANDFNASLAISYMQLANAIANYGAEFYLPGDAENQFRNDDEVGYFWTYGGYSYWMTMTEEGDNYVWTYEWEMPGIPRFTYITATESKDGKSGSWTIYDPESSSDKIWTYTWSIDDNDNFTASLVWYDDDDANSTSSFNVTDNADGSGTFTYTIDGSTEADITWNADGSGEYWINDGENGITDTWDAA